MTKNIIIIALSVLLLCSAFIIFKLEQPGKEFDDTKNFLFSEAVPDSVGREIIHNYRKRWSFTKKSNIVLYDSATIRKYLDSIYPRVKSEFETPANCNWMVGFYPMRRFDPDKKVNRLDFLVIPTLVTNTDPIKVYDFQTDTQYYRRVNEIKIETDPTCNICAGYDAGHLWP